MNTTHYKFVTNSLRKQLATIINLKHHHCVVEIQGVVSICLTKPLPIIYYY